MNKMHVFSIGVVAAGLTCVSGYAMASDKANGESTSEIRVAAEGAKGSGSSATEMGSGNMDADKKSGSSGTGMSSTAETGKNKQGSGTSSGSGTGMESGKSGSTGSSTGTSQKSSGDSDAYGAYYGPAGKGLSADSK